MNTEPHAISIDRLSTVTLVVEDQDAALEWYETVLGFETRMDAPFEMNGATGRWLTIAPPGNQEVEIALVEPDTGLHDDESLASLTSMHGTDAWWTFVTSDIQGTHAALREQGVTVEETPRETEWGTFAMFEDPDGNRLQLYEPFEATAE